MTTTGYDREPTDHVSGWAIGGTVFAASVLCLIGVFQMAAGIVAIVDDEFFVVAPNYTFDLDVTAWGWIHLCTGVLLAAAGFSLFGGAEWAGILAIVLASLSAIANFFFIPFYPFWAILLIVLNIWVIWSLTRPGVLND